MLSNTHSWNLLYWKCFILPNLTLIKGLVYSTTLWKHLKINPRLPWMFNVCNEKQCFCLTQSIDEAVYSACMSAYNTNVQW